MLYKEFQLPSFCLNAALNAEVSVLLPLSPVSFSCLCFFQLSDPFKMSSRVSNVRPPHTRRHSCHQIHSCRSGTVESGHFRLLTEFDVIAFQFFQFKLPKSQVSGKIQPDISGPDEIPSSLMENVCHASPSIPTAV